jgi:hypothetical protein
LSITGSNPTIIKLVSPFEDDSISGNGNSYKRSWEADINEIFAGYTELNYVLYNGTDPHGKDDQFRFTSGGFNIGYSQVDPLFIPHNGATNECQFTGTNIYFKTALCSSWGITFNHTNGTVSFHNTPVYKYNTTIKGIMNGSLSFKPF